MKIEVASLSHIGQVRERNEDALGHVHPVEKAALVEKGSLFVVADGMGGHRGGEIASKLAVDAIISKFNASKEKDTVRLLREAFEEAEAAGLHLCVDCGLCTYLCPSKIELLDQFNKAAELPNLRDSCFFF